MEPRDIVDFWLSLGPKKWFAKDDEVDREIARRFGDAHGEASAGRLDHWQTAPQGRLALLLLLDQFSRNLFRGDARAFAQDEQARALARDALAAGEDQEAAPELTAFFYMPFMHSEAIGDQMLCVRLCHSLGGDNNTLHFAKLHERIIRRFGRFPHRNGVLGRHTSPAEQRFLDEGGFAG